MSGMPGYNPFGGTSVNIFSPDAGAQAGYERWMAEYRKRMGIADPAEFTTPATPQEDPAKIQKMLYEYLAVVWGISQEQFDAGFEEYKKQLQVLEEKKKADVEAFVRQRMKIDPTPTNATAAETKQPETPQDTNVVKVGQKVNSGGNK